MNRSNTTAAQRSKSTKWRADRPAPSVQDELRLKNRTAEALLNTSDEEMFDRVLQIVLEASGSEHGIFGYVDEDGSIVCPAMTKNASRDRQMSDEPLVFPHDQWRGLWGRALAEKKSLYSNGGVRVPEGHIPIHRVLCVPILHQGELIGHFQIANKPTDYGRADVELLEGVVNYIAPVLHARLQRDRKEKERQRAENRLRRHSARLEEAVRERTADLDAANQLLRNEASQLAKTQEILAKSESRLRERVKELRCLYDISRLVDQHGDALQPILQGIVKILPASWQFPQHCRARLSIDGAYYGAAEPGRKAGATQSAEIRVFGETIGGLSVCYAKKMPQADEGPFLKEERQLLDAVAEQVGKIVEFIRTQHQLQAEREALGEANIALRTLMARVEDEKREIRDSVTDNIDTIVTPLLEALENDVSLQQKRQVHLIAEHLRDITSPFVNRVLKGPSNLTATEIEICNLVRKGLKSKQIAENRRVSPATVAKQRERIRRKLGIQGTDVRLGVHLQTLMSQATV